VIAVDTTERVLRGNDLSPRARGWADRVASDRLPAVLALAGLIATVVVLVVAPAAVAGTYTVVSCPGDDG